MTYAELQSMLWSQISALDDTLHRAMATDCADDVRTLIEAQGELLSFVLYHDLLECDDCCDDGEEPE